MFSDCLLYVGVLPAVYCLIFTTPSKGITFTDEATEAQRAEGTAQSQAVSDKTKLDLYQETKLASKQSKAEFSFSSKILSLQHHSLRLWVENPEA